MSAPRRSPSNHGQPWPVPVMLRWAAEDAWRTTAPVITEADLVPGMLRNAARHSWRLAQVMHTALVLPQWARDRWDAETTLREGNPAARLLWVPDWEPADQEDGPLWAAMVLGCFGSPVRLDNCWDYMGIARARYPQGVARPAPPAA